MKRLKGLTVQTVKLEHYDTQWGTAETLTLCEQCNKYEFTGICDDTVSESTCEHNQLMGTDEEENHVVYCDYVMP